MTNVAGIKSSVRIFGVGLWVAGLAVACSQLLGEIDIDGVPTEGTDIRSNQPDGGPEPLPIICEDGQTRCEEPLLQRCIDGGRAWLTTNVCATEALCQATDGTTVSQCLPPTCAVEQMSCEGAQLLLCNDGRNGWDSFDACESNAHCDATARACLDAPCETGQLRCNVGRLERCNELRTDWEVVDECETNELCEVTRTRAAAGTLGSAPGVGDGQGSAGSPVPPGTPAPLSCVVPECIPGERRCTGDRLEFCNEGRTGWELAETCATPVLCVNSLTYAGTGERPRCIRATCDVGEHECTEGGVLQVCDEGRDRFRQLETCIGPPFCNSVEADQGRAGCLAAPCASGQMQCNGPQRQVCRQDRTGFDPVGAPCETRDLCNDDDPANAFCRAPTCQRGPTSATEFRCQGSVLERCNDQHTGYERFAQCETAGLCNAGFGFEGCRPPVCAEGERRCQGDFVQVCNADRTAFVNFERCDAGTCDSVAGRCAMPCELGSRRCNNQGQVEECRDRLIGREVVARCASPQLCNAVAGTCQEPPAGCVADGVRRCRVQGQNTVLEECRDGRSRFVTLDTCSPAAGEICDPADVLCDVCQQGSQAVCEGTSVVTCAANGQSRTPTPCTFGCVAIAGAPDRCRDCALGGPGTCSGNVLTTCAEDADLTGQIRNNACTSGNACQTELSDCNRDGDGRDCSCTPCNEGQTSCTGAQPTACRNPQQGFVSDGAACRSAEHCDADRDSGTGCFECIRGELRCNDGNIQICNNSTNEFDPPAGPIQCIEGNRVALVCGNGPTPARDTCAADEFCDPRFGCVTCIPGDVDCDGDDRVVCAGDGSGFGSPQPCDTTSTCRQPGTCGAGACIAGGVSPAGTACTRVGNAPGFCEGTQCLECRANGGANQSRCEDGIDCTQGSCSNLGNCSQAPNNALCLDSEACDGAETCSVAQGCVDGPDLANGAMCSIVSGGSGVCNDGTCGQCTGNARTCGPNGRVRCQNGTLVADACPMNQPACINNGECVECNGNQTQACGDGESCVGNRCVQCSGNTAPTCANGQVVRTCVDGQFVDTRCTAPTPECAGGVCVECTGTGFTCAASGQSGARSECRAGDLIDAPCGPGLLCFGADAQCLQCQGNVGCAPGQRCDPQTNTCIECTNGDQRCINGAHQICRGGRFVADPCGEAEPICASNGTCVQCEGQNGCGDLQVCQDGSCVSSCGNDALDPGEACDGTRGIEPCPALGTRTCSADCLRVIDACLDIVPIPIPTDPTPAQ